MAAEFEVLTKAELPCFQVMRPAGKSPVFLICEHASNVIPERYGNLGLPEEALSSHIAWDPGALEVAMALSEIFDATLVSQRYSRLIYDCNRPPEALSAMPDTSEIYTIPGNQNLSLDERQARTQALYIPFGDAIRTLLNDRQQRGHETVIVTIHSFTPVYKGAERAVEVGILHDEDHSFADRMLDAAHKAPLYQTQRNEPYGPQDGVTHTLILHGLARRLPHVMLEIRNDLISDEIGQRVMADYLSGLIKKGLEGL